MWRISESALTTTLASTPVTRISTGYMAHSFRTVRGGVGFASRPAATVRPASRRFFDSLRRSISTRSQARAIGAERTTVGHGGKGGV